MNKFILLCLGLLYGTLASADAIDMQDYNLLRNGMTEAEVLLRIGPSDHEIVRGNRDNFISSKTWFYIPKQGSRNKWISELRFNADGVLISRDRYRTR